MEGRLFGPRDLQERRHLIPAPRVYAAHLLGLLAANLREQLPEVLTGVPIQAAVVYRERQDAAEDGQDVGERAGAEGPLRFDGPLGNEAEEMLLP